MPVLKHTHTYGRWKERGGELHFKCLDPACTHFAPRSLVIGKESKCSKCNNVVIFNWQQAERAKTLCIECQNTKEGRKHRARKAATEDLLSIAYGQPREDLTDMEKDLL